MQTSIPKKKAPYSQRFLIVLLSAVFALLVYWLLGFILEDIGEAPGPRLDMIQLRMVDQTLIQSDEALKHNLDALQQKIQEQKDQQALVQASMHNAQNAVQQLLAVQRSTTKTDENKKTDVTAYQDSLQLFLSEQKHFQAINESLERLNAEANQLRAKQQGIQKILDAERATAQKEYDRQWRHHAIIMGIIKISVLIPLLLIAGFLFSRYRQTLYSPLIYAGCIALLIKLFMIIHEYFPSQVFKYIIILVLIYVVVRILVMLLRRMAKPQIAYLLKQYCEAYARFLCPTCEYPIQRGPLKYSFWTRNTIQRLGVMRTTDTNRKEEKYTCPACGTNLFSTCDVCHDIRHSLLPYCEKCGAEKLLKEES